MKLIFRSFIHLLLLAMLWPAAVMGQEEGSSPDEAPDAEKKEEGREMDNEQLQQLIQRVDPEFTGRPGLWQLRVADVSVRVITDPENDRMRIMLPIRKTEDISRDELYRISQANFDTTLDARYAIAKGVLWSTFVHPLSSLTDQDFLSGLGQAVNIARTYGETYSSGLLNFSGGDSGNIIERELLEELKKKGEVI